jgi:hypothetical protein
LRHEDDARVEIERAFYSANARLRLVGPKEVVSATEKVERFVIEWQESPSVAVAKKWPVSLRPEVINVLRKACWADTGNPSR